MNDEFIKQLKSKGYVLIKNDMSMEEVDRWKKLVPAIKKEAILQKFQKKESKSSTLSNIFSDENEKFYVWKCQNILQTFDLGRKNIEKYSKFLQNVHPNIRFIKDRFMNQKKNYHGHLPHQDNFAGGHELITDQWYTVYTSLTDTDTQSGCIWIEDIQGKRNENLNMCTDGCVKGKTCHCINIKVMPFDIENFKGYKMKPIELKKGDTIIFDGYTLHGTAANLKNEHRQTLMFTYGVVRDEDLQIEDIFQHYHQKHIKNIEIS